MKLLRKLSGPFGAKEGGRDSVYLPLVTSDDPTGNPVVRSLGPDPRASVAEPLGPAAGGQGVFTHAMPSPLAMEIDVPLSLGEERVMIAKGPGGPVKVQLPPDARPGSKVNCRIAPRPEFRITVPPGAKPGQSIKFRKDSGEEVQVSVPPGRSAGDIFDVSPPAFIVYVPEGLAPGDYVVFSETVEGDRKGATRQEFYRAKIPDGILPMEHFSAIIQAPGSGIFEDCDELV